MTVIDEIAAERRRQEDRVPTMPQAIAAVFLIVGLSTVSLGAFFMWGFPAGMMAFGAVLLALVWRFA
jgi:hypothetical protein